MSLAEDHLSGSTGVAMRFLDELETWLATDRSRAAAGLRQALYEWLRAAQASQPTMALVHQLAARALEVANAGVSREVGAPELRQSLSQSCASEREDLAAAQLGAAQLAVGLLNETDAFVATLSASSAVRDALLLAKRLNRAPRVLLSESRPLFEGRALAAGLAAAGIPVWLVVDAALPMLLSGARMVWIGADAITDRGVVNKVGSFALALAAREHSVPVYVIATRRKFLPASTGALKIQELSPDEVWTEAPRGVLPRNVCFELVPFELIRGIVVEDAVLGITEARTVALDRALPEELANS